MSAALGRWNAGVFRHGRRDKAAHDAYERISCCPASCCDLPFARPRFSRWQRHCGNQTIVRLVETCVVLSTSFQIVFYVYRFIFRNRWEFFCRRKKKKDPLNIELRKRSRGWSCIDNLWITQFFFYYFFSKIEKFYVGNFVVWLTSNEIRKYTMKDWINEGVISVYVWNIVNVIRVL